MAEYGKEAKKNELESVDYFTDDEDGNLNYSPSKNPSAGFIRQYKGYYFRFSYIWTQL